VRLVAAEAAEWEPLRVFLAARVAARVAPEELVLMER
jgi:hypothetical protein